MKNIAEIDKNFVVDTQIKKEGIRFYDCKDEPFKVYGIFHQDGKFRRLPEAVAKTVNDGVYGLHANTAGGRVRFKTDSAYVAISARMGGVGKMPHFAFSGSVGIDLYVGTEYAGTFMPDVNIDNGDRLENIIEFDSSEMREITINFPLYSEVCELYIGLDGESQIAEPEPYKYDKPVVYYGSSITQGGCASRAGTSYEGFISRRFNCDYINLGFSGSARGEDEITEYIKELDMKLFVYDYDYNAPTVEHLKNTHEKMFKAIRNNNPDLPIIMLTRPKFHPTADEVERKAIVRTTYENAINSGDKNVYFIDGKELMTYCGNEGTVDCTHPTDLGFASMAKVLGDFIEDKKLL